MLRWRFRIGFWLLAGLLLMLRTAQPARAADQYTTGQKVEVREGDTWSPATILAHEGRKFQVHYTGDATASDEWVATDRIRLPGAAPAKMPEADKYGGFKVGDKVEVKWGGLWRKADIVKQGNGWTLISYNTMSFEWVQPWRIRAVGSTTDTAGYAQPREEVKKNSPPPTLAPEPEESADSSTPHAHPRHTSGAGADADPAIPTATVTDDVAAAMRLTKCDLSSGRDLEPREIEEPLTPDATVSAHAPKMISLHHGPPAWGTRSEMFLHPQGKFAMMAFSPRSNDEPTSIQLVELAGSDALKVTPLPSHDYPLAISPDGKRMAARANREVRESMWRLDIWAIDSSTPKPLLSFRPYDNVAAASDAVIQAFFPDSTHLLTISANHLITLWEISDTTVKEIYSLQSDGSIFPQLSPGGKFIVVGYDAQIMLCDVLTGKCVAKTAELVGINGLTSALRADAKRLAVVGERRLIVLDVEQSKVVFDIGMPENLHGSKIAWLGMNLLMIDDHLVFDAEHQAPVWDYTMTGGVPLASLEGDHFWYLSQSMGGTEGNNRSFLTSFSLPDARVQAADQKIPDGVQLVHAGSTISLEVNFSGSAEDRQKIVDRFTKQLTANGISIADGEPTKLICETKAGQSQTGTFHHNNMFGNGGNRPDETVTATQTIYRVAFEADGKELWAVNNVSGGYLPNMIWEKKDQTAADIIAEENKPQLSWFLHVDLPKTILKPADPVGTSVFASTGAVGRSRNGR